MRKIITIIAAVLVTVSVFAQAPQKMSYQAVIRNTGNVLVTSTPVGMQISILQGSSTGTAVYVETQTPSTNANGLVSLEIGTGTIVTGTFAGINWANGPYFIKTETDPTGGTAYTIAGTNELMSVPYALFSATGIAGPAGPQGVAGVDGATGPAGPQGVAGVDGATGPAGPQGAAGVDGATGSAGPQGVAGVDGAIGPIGPQGVAGVDGAIGPIGPQGVAGVDGAKGDKGDKGDIGLQGPIGGFSHYLGEDFNGGIIFYLYKGNDGLEHGLIVSKTVGAAAVWQSIETVTGADRTEDGKYNTAQMVLGNSEAATSVYMTTTLGAGWYIPSVDELALLFYNRYSAQKGLRAAVGADLLSNTASYWSSMESGQTAAYVFDFSSGTLYTDAKSNLNTLRGITKF